MNILNCKTWIILNLERAQSRPHIRCPTISAAERALSRINDSDISCIDDSDRDKSRPYDWWTVINHAPTIGGP